MNTKIRFWISLVFILWLTVLLAAFFVVQKPSWASVIYGLGLLLGTISIWLLFVLSSTGIGYFMFDNFLKIDSIHPYQRIIFSIGFGMGVFGLFGFIFAVTGLGNKWFLLTVLVIVFCFTWHTHKSIIRQDAINSLKILFRSKKYTPYWIPLFFVIIFSLSFLLALAPPIEAFDGLLYHLTVPAWWLRDGSVQLVDFHPYWYPSLMEGMFVFPLAFDLDSTPQLIHWTFALLCSGFIFGWTQKLFGSRAAWWGVAMIISMPSISWISAWSYTDLGLTFYSLVTLFALAKWMKDDANERWLFLSGIFCGFAVGIKYTIFSLPILVCLLLYWHLKSDIKKLIQNTMYFIVPTLCFGGIWYLRNLIWVGNPFYPFVFGGTYWDSFRAEWYANTGTGIGFDLFKIITLPFTTMLGFQDQTFFDGRMGPFYIILFPTFLFAVWEIYKNKQRRVPDTIILSLFGFLIISFWVIGVTQSISLIQARLLFPGLIALIPLFGKSILHLESLNTPKLRPKFLFSALMFLTILVAIVDFALLVLFRNPLMVHVGSISRESYTQRFNSSYSELLILSDQTPQDAFIYLINEPRSYGINRTVQPDPINDNLPHDFYLYKTNTELIATWKQIGYTHVLARSFIFQPSNENQQVIIRLIELKRMLTEIESTKEYILFQIP